MSRPNRKGTKGSFIEKGINKTERLKIQAFCFVCLFQLFFMVLNELCFSMLFHLFFWIRIPFSFMTAAALRTPPGTFGYPRPP